mgnify:CR=1 FL=1
MGAKEGILPGAVEGGLRRQRVLIFVLVTFGLTYAYNLLMFLTVGYGATPAAGLMLQAMMLIPAWVALLLQVFVFRDSEFDWRSGFSWLHAFVYLFLAYGLVYLVGGVLSAAVLDASGQMLAMGATQFVTLVVLGVVILSQFLIPKPERERWGLAFGPFKWYVLFTVLLAAMYGAMTWLNSVFHLGEAVDAKALIGELARAAGQSATGLEDMSNLQFLLIMGIQSAVLTPLIALPITFGEEFGWRGFLQAELIKLGKVRGVALVGLIWGLWHAPVIAMGHNYPGYPVAGIFLMTVYCVLLGFILGLAVLKSKSVWLAAYLHGVNNQTLSFLSMLVYKPADPVFSFGIGLYGLMTMALVVGLLLLDKTWRQA